MTEPRKYRIPVLLPRLKSEKRNPAHTEKTITAPTTQLSYYYTDYSKSYAALAKTPDEPLTDLTYNRI